MVSDFDESAIISIKKLVKAHQYLDACKHLLYHGPHLEGSTIKKHLCFLLSLAIYLLSVALSLLTRNSSYFSIMLLWSLALALLGTIRLTLVATAISIASAMVMTFGILKRPFMVEAVFVSLVWIAVVGIILNMRRLNGMVKQQREELREKNELYRRLMELSPDAIVVTDLETRIISCSERHLPMLGAASLEDVIGKSAIDFIAPGDRQRAIENITRTAEQGSLYDVEYQALRLDGAPFDARLAVSLLTNEKGEPWRFVAYLRDCTRDNEDRRKLEMLAQERDRLVHEVQHRVKNHMNTIRSLLLLQRDSQNDPVLSAALEEAEGRVTLMMNLYQKLSDDPGSQWVNLSEYIADIIADIRSSINGSRPITLEEDLSRITETRVSAHQALPIGIMINELVTNSWKYAFGDDGGTVKILLRPEGRKLHLSVSDNGCGFQGSPPKPGFGLSIVEGYARQFGGELEIESRNGFSVATTIDLEP